MTKSEQMTNLVNLITKAVDAYNFCAVNNPDDVSRWSYRILGIQECAMCMEYTITLRWSRDRNTITVVDIYRHNDRGETLDSKHLRFVKEA